MTPDQRTFARKLNVSIDGDSVLEHDDNRSDPVFIEAKKALRQMAMKREETVLDLLIGNQKGDAC